MDINNYLRCKGLPDEIYFQLLEIVRRENAIEGLIDFIEEISAGNIRVDNDETNEYVDKIQNLEEKISELEEKLEECTESRDELEEAEQLKSERLSEFVENFQEKNNRYPSIDEAWEAAWNGSK